MEATDQGAATNSHVAGSPVMDSRENFTTYVNPLVQERPTNDTSFHSPIEGHIDSLVETEYGPNALFSFLDNFYWSSHFQVWGY